MFVRFRHMSLTKKATLISIFCLIIPASVFAFYLYFHQVKQIYSQACKDRQLAVEQLADNIKTGLTSTEDLSLNLTYRSPIISLVGKKDLGEYPVYTKRSSEDILTALKYSLIYQNSGILDACIYTNNPGLNDVDHFYSSDVISGLSFYEDFCHMEKNYDAYYLPPEETAEYYKQKGTSCTASHGLLLFVRKIENPFSSDYSGFLVFETDPYQFFSSLSSFVGEESGYSLYFTNIGTSFGSDIPDELTEELQHSSSSAVSLKNEDSVYLSKSLTPYSIVLINTEPLTRKTYALPPLKLSLLMIVMVLIQFLILRFLIHYIFGRINDNITEMDRIIANGFTGKLPVTSLDELGLVSQRYNTLLEKISTLVTDIIRTETASKNAQIKALQYQMNPHFIYNTLSIFAGNAEQNGNHQLSEAISYFGHLLRYNIKDTGLYSTVEKEIQNAYYLIQVYSMRYRGSLVLNVEIPEYMKQLKLIKFLMQPLIENAILHGKQKGNENMTIHLSLTTIQTSMVLKISDNGIGMSPERLADVREHILHGTQLSDNAHTDSSSVGLHNVYKRLQLVYGSNANLEIDSSNHIGTCVTVTIPLSDETGGPKK